MHPVLQRHPALRFLLYVGVPAIASTLVFGRLYRHGLVNLLIDAQSHWLHAFLIVHSITPGVSQIGFWPPLLHVILVPVTLLLPVVLLKDVGAFITLLPMLIATAYFMRGILRNTGVSQGLSTVGGALVLLHPFMQYFTSSAMAEIPFVFSVLGTAYFGSRWRISSTMWDLSLFGIFVSLTVMSRYEGVLIAPISAVFVLSDRIRKKISFVQWKAEFMIFVFMASVGPALILIYSYAYSGSIFGFMSLGSDFVFDSAPVRRLPFTLDVAREKLRFFYYASLYLHGRVAVFLFPIGVALIVLRRKWIAFLILLIMSAPSLLIMYFMVRGRNNIITPDGADPHALFANTRYALTWVGALIFSLVSAIDAIPSKRRIGKILRAASATALIAISAMWFVQVCYVSDFNTIRQDETATLPLPESFFTEYDSGRVLMTRDHNVREVYFSVVPTNELIIETNYQRFEQAMREPWLFARWVIIRPSGGKNGEFKRLQDLVRLEKTPEFQRYYELVRVTDVHRIYRLNENVLRATALSMGYNVKNIPSLNPGKAWNPATVYADIQRR